VVLNEPLVVSLSLRPWSCGIYIDCSDKKSLGAALRRWPFGFNVKLIQEFSKALNKVLDFSFTLNYFKCELYVGISR
jgi:hypothetical protein